MKICIIGTVGVPACYGGFETLVDYIIESEVGEFTVYCSGKHYSNRLETYKKAKLVYIPVNANGFMSVVYDVVSIIHALYSGHRNFLILGVSGAIIIPLMRFCPKLYTVTNIDGIEWRRFKWRGFSKWFLKFSESLAVKYSSVVVADNEAIAQYVDENYHRECETIEYGGDHALIPIVNNELLLSLDIDYSYALSLCRIEPENNVHLILEAFSRTNKNIIFIGNWDSSNYGRRLKVQFAHFNNIRLIGPIYDLATLSAYRTQCDTYIHGHSAGGTNPSLVEMMHFSKNIIAFDCSYNRATMENNGVYFNSTESLIKILLDEDSTTAAAQLFEVASRRYTWDIVTRKYLSLFYRQEDST